MSVESTPEDGDARAAHIQLALTLAEAERLRTTLPWLLHALADRPTLPPRQRERRRNAYATLDHLLSAVSSQLQQAEAEERVRSTGAINV